ncbi:hypothetical protein [Paludisphaera soli]|uniref:hypothetical protein n=1 Tax=Paludisphaera soli TaxID=2712865 RepID=UPI0013EDBD6B|nr:hypothetical protein [Paludisphaera soli]
MRLAVGPPTEFFALTWIYRASAIVTGGLAAFAATLGPLFLLGLMKNARDEPASGAGVALSIMAVPLALAFALATANLRARRKPLLTIRREGVEVVRIGETALDRVPFVPGLVRLTWLIVTGQGFRRRVVRIAWRDLRKVFVSGPPMARVLNLGVRWGSEHEPGFAIQQVELRRPLDEVADAIRSYSGDAEARARLKGWGEDGLFL